MPGFRINDAFPRYTDFGPKVPVWCVTPNEGRCIHRFFDTSPFSPSGRYMAFFRVPYEDHTPEPGDAGQVVLVDLHTAAERVVADSRGWELQMGANLQWGADDETLFFNDVDTARWAAFSWKLNPHTGERHKLAGCVYQASPDGRKLASANMRAMRRTQEGYGVVVPDELVPSNPGFSDTDGLFITDTETGECELLVSIKQFMEECTPALDPEEYANGECYGFHTKWNPQGDRLIFTTRWFPVDQPHRFNTLHHGVVRFNVFTLKADGTEIYDAVSAEQWDKGGHHINWYPDGRQLSMNLNIYRNGLKLVKVNYDGSDLGLITDKVPGSGHPSVHPDGRHIVSDAYIGEPVGFEDGTVPIRLIDLETGSDTCIVRIDTRQPYKGSPLRIDPHPAWDREWKRIALNVYLGGARRVLVADLSDVVG
jgi:Tol biopolymer transport system component